MRNKSFKSSSSIAGGGTGGSMMRCGIRVSRAAAALLVEVLVVV